MRKLGWAVANQNPAIPHHWLAPETIGGNYQTVPGAAYHFKSKFQKITCPCANFRMSEYMRPIPTIVRLIREAGVDLSEAIQITYPKTSWTNFVFAKVVPRPSIRFLTLSQCGCLKFLPAVYLIVTIERTCQRLLILRYTR